MAKAASARVPVEDDVTVDDLMDALDEYINWHRARSGNGHTEERVEVDPCKHFEELIAPELLFPDEADGSE